jgi:hypothetical protein
MGYIFDDWKKLLENFQSSVEKDLEEIHQQKSEVQQIKADIFSRLDKGLYYRDEDCLILSAPKVIIGNVDKSGDLLGGGIGEVVIKGNGVALEGVGDSGHVITRAPSIRQTAVNPGIDGLENVVGNISEVISQAGNIVLHSSDAKDIFSQAPASAGNGGISIHADKMLNLEAAVSAESRKEQIEAAVETLSQEATDLKKQIEGQKASVEECFKKMSDLLDKEDKLNSEKKFLNRTKLKDINEIHEDMESMTPVLYQATLQFIHLVSRLSEVNRRKKALEAEKDEIKTGDEFKDNTTGASMNIVAESISVATADADGNLHTNDEAGISVRTPNINLSMADDKGKLVEGGGFAVNAENISLSSFNPSDDGKELPVKGNVNIYSKTISLEAIDYQVDDDGAKEKELTADGKISMTAKTVEVSTANPSNVERDEEGKLSKGEFMSEGDVIFKTKTFAVESLDYEVKDGKLETKALTKDGKISIRAEKTDVLAADAEGKATGAINLNAKAVSVKSMDVDKEKLTDDKLAEGSTMTLVSEKMYVGAKSKDVKSKKLQAMSEEIGAFADKTLEIQQGDGKAVVQLDGGNAAVGGSKTEVYGATTINGKTEVKDELKAPKATIDNIEAKSSFKSPNISDGMAVPGAAGSGSLSAKLKAEDAPKE